MTEKSFKKSVVKIRRKLLYKHMELVRSEKAMSREELMDMMIKINRRALNKLGSDRMIQSQIRYIKRGSDNDQA